MMKEPFLFLGIGLFCFGLLSESSLIKRIFCLVVSLILLIGFKPYILVCLIVTLIFVFWYNFLKQRLILSLGAFVLLILSLAFALPSSRISVVHYLTRKQFDFINVGKGGLHVQADSTYYFFEPHQYKKLKMSDGFVELQVPTKALYYRFGSKESPHSVFLTPTGKKWPIVYFKPGCESYIEIKRIDESAIQLIKNIPEAFFNAFLRPLPWDNGSDLKYLAMVEVWLIIGIIVLSLVHRRKLNKTEKNVLIGLFFFALLLFTLIGWTTPVIGAIARYRFPAQLAVILGCLILIDTSRWRKNSR